ncbi:winged helix DNA-binding protein [Hyphomonas sp.]|uniref:winged helix DNA-binding protein n=1 Tax=Hyphomonas sp. TaxID=87 RepID=UPI0035643395
MTDNAPYTDEIVDLLVYLGRPSRGTRPSSDLTAAQWMAMRFFARANRASRTPSAFASFHATTLGAASQIIKSLMLKGFLIRHQSFEDRRSVRFDLTKSGKFVMRHDPLRDLSEAIERIDGGLCIALRQVLPVLAGELAKIRDTVAVGACGDRRYFSYGGEANNCTCVGVEPGPDDLGDHCVNLAAS